MEFKPRNKLDSQIFELMKESIEAHHIEQMNQAKIHNIDNNFDALLSAYKVPVDQTIDKPFGFSRDWFMDKFYSYNPEEIYKLSDEIKKFEVDNDF